MFYKPLSFAFHFKHPNTSDCCLSGKCGFLLKCTPDMKSGEPHKFEVNLCLDQEEYPEGLHIHPEFVKANKIHLVPLIECDSKMRYCLAMFTWNMLGISEVIVEESLPVWTIGSSEIYSDAFLKLCAFITL